ncbi:unnamed protein product [marine sediment metagenome]|uniref:Uncharacterized protein n=1 Tax=marine sediment metagenome TaxID=412755 RepID=X0WD43_9ZZZZ
MAPPKPPANPACRLCGQATKVHGRFRVRVPSAEWGEWVVYLVCAAYHVTRA